MTKSAHGGSRPKTRPDDKRGGARKGTGPLPKNVTIGPFLANKSDTVSKCHMTVYRCNYCGNHWIDGYDEEIYGWTGDKPTVLVWHDGIEETHKDWCVNLHTYSVEA